MFLHEAGRKLVVLEVGWACRHNNSAHRGGQHATTARHGHNPIGPSACRKTYICDLHHSRFPRSTSVSMPGPTKAQLIKEIAQLKQKYEAEKEALRAELATAQHTNEEQATNITELTAAVNEARAQVQAAVAAHNMHPGAAQGADTDDNSVAKPLGAFSLRQSIGLTRMEMADIRATVHELVARVGLDWHERLSHQTSSKLTDLYKLARKEQPILRRFQHDWVTTEIVKTFMQNKRKMARKRGAMAPSGVRRNHTARIENLPAPNSDTSDVDM